MITRFHRIDKHIEYSTISVSNRQGEEIDFKERCHELKEYIEKLGSEDAAVIKFYTGVSAGLIR